MYEEGLLEIPEGLRERMRMEAYISAWPNNGLNEKKELLFRVVDLLLLPERRNIPVVEKRRE